MATYFSDELNEVLAYDLKICGDSILEDLCEQINENINFDYKVIGYKDMPTFGENLFLSLNGPLIKILFIGIKSDYKFFKIFPNERLSIVGKSVIVYLTHQIGRFLTLDDDFYANCFLEKFGNYIPLYERNPQLYVIDRSKHQREHMCGYYGFFLPITWEKITKAYDCTPELVNEEFNEINGKQTEILFRIYLTSVMGVPLRMVNPEFVCVEEDVKEIYPELKEVEFPAKVEESTSSCIILENVPGYFMKFIFSKFIERKE